MKKTYCCCMNRLEVSDMFEVGKHYEYNYKDILGYIKIYSNDNHIQLTHKEFRRYFLPLAEARDKLIDRIINE